MIAYRTIQAAEQGRDKFHALYGSDGHTYKIVPAYRFDGQPCFAVETYSAKGNFMGYI